MEKNIKVIWVLVNCNNVKEAESIGRVMLKKRLASCFDIVPRHLAAYFWPPESGKIETSRGVILILETFERKYKPVFKEVKKVHSDKLPFIGFIDIKGIAPEYIKWMKGELK